jgi:Tfp pilus assembly protein FimT
VRPAFSLFEVVVVCTIIGLAGGIAAPRIRATMDSLAVEGATRDLVNAFAYARVAAIRDRGAEVLLDSVGVRVRAAGRIVHERQVAPRHGVRVRPNTSLIRYAATGLAMGVGNGSVVVSRGSRADTVVISRLGRVRR